MCCVIVVLRHIITEKMFSNYIFNDMDGRKMLNTSSLKNALVKQVDATFYNTYHDSVDLKSALFDKLSDSSFDDTDNSTLKLIIENHLTMLAPTPENKDVFHDNESIDGVMSDLFSLAAANQSKSLGAFADPFAGKSSAVDRNRSEEISKKRNAIILAYFESSNDWSNADVKKFELPTIEQVGYPEDEEYMPQKDKFTLRESRSFDLLARHINPETNFEPIRFIGDKEIAIDFEDIGYHIRTSHPVSEYLDIIELEGMATDMKNKFDAEADLRRFNRNVEYILEKTCDHMESLFGQEFPNSIIKNGSEISRLLSLHAKSNSPINNIKSLIEPFISSDPNQQILAREFLPRIEQMFKS